MGFFQEVLADVTMEVVNRILCKRGFAKGARKNLDGSDNKTFNRTEAQYNADQAKKGNK